MHFDHRSRTTIKDKSCSSQCHGKLISEEDISYANPKKKERNKSDVSTIPT